MEIKVSDVTQYLRQVYGQQSRLSYYRVLKVFWANHRPKKSNTSAISDCFRHLIENYSMSLSCF